MTRFTLKVTGNDSPGVDWVAYNKEIAEKDAEMLRERGFNVEIIEENLNVS